MAGFILEKTNTTLQQAAFICDVQYGHAVMLNRYIKGGPTIAQIVITFHLDRENNRQCYIALLQNRAHWFMINILWHVPTYASIMSEDACTMFISDRNPIEILSQCTILSECMLSYLIELWDHDKSCHLKNVYCDLPYQKAQQIAQEQVHQLAIPEVPWSTMNYVNCGVCNTLYDSGNLAL